MTYHLSVREPDRRLRERPSRSDADAVICDTPHTGILRQNLLTNISGRTKKYRVSPLGRAEKKSPACLIVANVLGWRTASTLGGRTKKHGDVQGSRLPAIFRHFLDLVFCSQTSSETGKVQMTDETLVVRWDSPRYFFYIFCCAAMTSIETFLPHCKKLDIYFVLIRQFCPKSTRLPRFSFIREFRTQGGTRNAVGGTRYAVRDGSTLFFTAFAVIHLADNLVALGEARRPVSGKRKGGDGNAAS